MSRTKDWNRLVAEGFVELEEELRPAFPFKRMCQLYGSAYLDYLRAAYRAKGELTDEEFVTLHELPLGFFQKQVKETVDAI